MRVRTLNQAILFFKHVFLWIIIISKLAIFLNYKDRKPNLKINFPGIYFNSIRKLFCNSILQPSYLTIFFILWTFITFIWKNSQKFQFKKQKLDRKLLDHHQPPFRVKVVRDQWTKCFLLRNLNFMLWLTRPENVCQWLLVVSWEEKERKIFSASYFISPVISSRNTTFPSSKIHFLILERESFYISLRLLSFQHSHHSSVLWESGVKLLLSPKLLLQNEKTAKRRVHWLFDLFSFDKSSDVEFALTRHWNLRFQCRRSQRFSSLSRWCKKNRQAGNWAKQFNFNTTTDLLMTQ